MNRTLRLIEKPKDDKPDTEPQRALPEGFAPARVATRSHQASPPEHLVSDTLPDLAPGERPLGPGQTIDQYTVDRLIASGGTARVYRATHRFMGHVIALKVLRENIARRPDLVERFQKEARALKQIKHANIVDIETAGLTERGEPFIAMEYVEGDPLRDRLESGWRPPLVETLNILISVADGVQAAHEIGIVHRDLKPENIMCPGSGGVKVVDFGLARVVDAKQTDAKGVVGTAAYIAPERLNGMPGDIRSDIYSLGIMAYELIDGRNPMTGTGRTLRAAEVAANQLTHQPAWLWNVPEQLAKTVARAIEKRPASRFASMQEFSAALREARAHMIEQQDAAERARKAIASERAIAEPNRAPGQRDGNPVSGAHRTQASRVSDAAHARDPAPAAGGHKRASHTLPSLAPPTPLSQALTHELAKHPFRLPLAIGAVVGLTVALSAFFLQRSGRGEATQGSAVGSDEATAPAATLSPPNVVKSPTGASASPLAASPAAATEPAPTDGLAQTPPAGEAVTANPLAVASAAGTVATATKAKPAVAPTASPKSEPAAGRPPRGVFDGPIFGNDDSRKPAALPRDPQRPFIDEPPAKKPAKPANPPKSDLPGSGLASGPGASAADPITVQISVPPWPPKAPIAPESSCLPKMPGSGLDHNACGSKTDPAENDEHHE